MNDLFIVRIYEINRWILEINQDIDNENKIHLKILDMIDNINEESKSNPLTKFPDQIMSLIEIKIDETEFDE